MLTTCWPPPFIRPLYCRFRPGEPWHERHSRRLRAAKKHQGRLYVACRVYNVTMSVRDSVWYFELQDGSIFGWEPYDGRLFRLGDHDEAMKTYDVRQTCFILGWLHGDLTEADQRSRRVQLREEPIPIDLLKKKNGKKNRLRRERYEAREAISASLALALEDS